MSEQVIASLEAQNKKLKEKVAKLQTDLKKGADTKKLESEKLELLKRVQELEATHVTDEKEKLELVEKLETAVTDSQTLTNETKAELLDLAQFLRACYKESESVSVRTNLQKWTKLLNDLAS